MNRVTKLVKGSDLKPEIQRQCLARFVHRFTSEHVPQWARNPRPDGSKYEPQFTSDAEWLANTEFYVKRDGTLDERFSYCHSNPTWPLKHLTERAKT